MTRAAVLVATLAALMAMLAALAPLQAVAAPIPTPSLDKILVAPLDTNFLEAGPATGLFEGPFDPHQYAVIEGGSKQSQVEQTLVHDGFVAGYGRTWLEHGGHRAYVEAVTAFDGGDGANAWLQQAEAGDKAGGTYQQALTVSGLGTYYGARLVDTTNHLYADAFAFVKGNDVFLVSTVSGQDDLADLAGTQTKRQYDTAPDYTIPPSSWRHVTSTAFDAGSLAGRLVIYLLIAAVVLLVVGLVLRSRRRPGLVPIATSGVQLSPDGRFWWDGQAWRDAEVEAPPYAPRSADGQLWWDGSRWRQLPSPAVPSKG